MIFRSQGKFFTPLLPARQKSQNHNMNWKQKFKLQAYYINYKKISRNHEETFSDNQTCNKSGTQLLKQIRIHKEYKNQNNTNKIQKINHPYCVFVPLKKNVQLDDEIVNTFVYLRNLKQTNNLLEQDNFYTQIRKFMKQCKLNNRVKQGWKTCLKRFIDGVDVLTRIQIFIQLQKYGSSIIEGFHFKFSKNTLIDVFFQKIIAVNRYFTNQVKINKTWKISLQFKDKINEATISKTMKMMYCSICLIYDCGKHKMQDASHQKDHHYSSPKNHIPTVVHISKAIHLLRQLKNFQSGMKADGQICSNCCFKELLKDSYNEMVLLKSRLISPVTESLIKMGIQIYSYSPCQISSMFPKENNAFFKINCSVVFLYIIQQISLQSRLSFKIYSSQAQHLHKESTNQISTFAKKQINKNLLNLRKKKLAKQTDQFKYQQVAICCHSYINQQIFDEGCMNCACSKRGFCLPECQCGDKCSIILKGCNCKSKQQCQTSKCSCYRSKNQCIPNVCHNCFPSNSHTKKNCCKNDQILRGITKNIKVSHSKIQGAGFGAFAGQFIKKGSLISLYCGQVLDQQMQNIRQTLKKGESFYNFACSQGSIDARFMGNKTRFLNHAHQYQKKTNVVSLNMFSCGQEYIGLYALRDIKQGQQLLFDYDGEGQVAKTYSGIYSFLQKNIVKLQRVQHD